jgi:hypothetical protein
MSYSKYKQGLRRLGTLQGGERPDQTGDNTK